MVRAKQLWTILLVVALVTMAFAAPVGANVYGRDISAEAGITFTGMTYQAAVADYDGDGDDDFLLGTHAAGPARLYRNDGGRFVEVFAGTFRKKDRHACAWGDANSDGRLDVFCTIGGDRGNSPAKSNELWLQQSEGGFVDVGEAWGVPDTYGRGRDAVFLHADDDEHDDLFVSNLTTRPDGKPTNNRLYLNEGGSSYRSVPGHGLDTSFTANYVSSGDYNNDGWTDVMHAAGALKLFRNDRGEGFTNVTGAVALKGRAKQAALADMNCDGRLDIARVFTNVFEIDLQRDNGTFGRADYRLPLKAGLALAVGQADGKDCRDVYVLQGRIKAGEQPDVMLLNDGTGKRFTTAAMAQTKQGAGQDVSAIDHDGDGRDAFLVLNGNAPKHPGPVRLVSFE